MNDATTALIRCIRLNFLTSGFIVEEIRSRDWASATFTGVRHDLTFTIEGDGAEVAADLFFHDLDEREFDLRGHILAEIALVSRHPSSGFPGPLVRIRLEALTMENS